MAAGMFPDSTSAFRGTQGKWELQLALAHRFWAPEKRQEGMASLQNSLSEAEAFKAKFAGSELGLGQSTFHFFFGAVGSRVCSTVGCSRLSSLVGTSQSMDHLRLVCFRAWSLNPGCTHRRCLAIQARSPLCRHLLSHPPGSKHILGAARETVQGPIPRVGMMLLMDVEKTRRIFSHLQSHGQMSPPKLTARPSRRVQSNQRLPVISRSPPRVSTARLSAPWTVEASGN